MTNKYAGRCVACGAVVPANGGTLRKSKAGRYYVLHLACEQTGKPEVVSFYSPVTGHSWTQNRKGRCEDAPCCGCCD